MAEKMGSVILGQYELVEKIGEGGFGIVYRARDLQQDRDVAVKVLRPDLASSPDFIERFQREARLASSLHHPNIVTVHTIGEHEGRYYIVMEHLQGQSLSELLVDGKPLTQARALEILRPLAAALDYAHIQGVIHRDIKPSNVILADGGTRPVLTDFGLVKSVLEQGNTTTGITLGTPEYMSPEQITGQLTSPASDLYALGVIAYQMLTGRAPFTGRTPFEIQMGHVQRLPPPPRKLNPALPEVLARVLMRALGKNPTQRYPTGAALVAALEQFMPRPIQPAAASRPTPSPAPVARQSIPVAPASRPVEQPRMTPVKQPSNLAQRAAQPGSGQKNTTGMLLTLGIGFSIAIIIPVIMVLGSLFLLIVDSIIIFITFSLMTILAARRVLHCQRFPWLAILVCLICLSLTSLLAWIVPGGTAVYKVLFEGTMDFNQEILWMILYYASIWLIGGSITTVLTTILWNRMK